MGSFFFLYCCRQALPGTCQHSPPHETWNGASGQRVGVGRRRPPARQGAWARDDAPPSWIPFVRPGGGSHALCERAGGAALPPRAGLSSCPDGARGRQAGGRRAYGHSPAGAVRQRSCHPGPTWPGRTRSFLHTNTKTYRSFFFYFFYFYFIIIIIFLTEVQIGKTWQFCCVWLVNHRIVNSDWTGTARREWCEMWSVLCFAFCVSYILLLRILFSVFFTSPSLCFCSVRVSTAFMTILMTSYWMFPTRTKSCQVSQPAVWMPRSFPNRSMMLFQQGENEGW